VTIVNKEDLSSGMRSHIPPGSSVFRRFSPVSDFRPPTSGFVRPSSERERSSVFHLSLTRSRRFILSILFILSKSADSRIAYNFCLLSSPERYILLVRRERVEVYHDSPSYDKDVIKGTGSYT
jgi:hypothetical protein